MIGSTNVDRWWLADEPRAYSSVRLSDVTLDSLPDTVQVMMACVVEYAKAEERDLRPLLLSVESDPGCGQVLFLREVDL